MLIGLNGPAGAGKDTFANFLKPYGVKRYAFADAVREAALAINPIVWLPMGDGEPYGRLSDIVGEQGWDSAKRNVYEVRRLLQVIGTEVGRQILGPNCWVEIVKRKWYEDGKPPAVITDMRFPNEYQWIKEEHGVTVQVIRYDNPDAIGTSHISEKFQFNCDYILVNEGAVEQFGDSVAAFYASLGRDGLW